MKFKLTIGMDNAAFEDCNGTELGRILEGLVNTVKEEILEPSDTSAPIRDINGNKVGSWEVVED